MEIVAVPVTSFQENTYFYYDGLQSDGVVIDPGGEADKLIRFISEHRIKLCGILLTHVHFDHIGAADAVSKATGAPVLIHGEDAENVEEINIMFGRGAVSLNIDRCLRDGDVFSFGGNELLLIHTPGHTPGSSCYYSKREKILFAGDTLFLESVGRTDLPGGDTETLKDSIRSKLYTLPDDVRVYPGHGSATSIGYEKKYNPFV